MSIFKMNFSRRLIITSVKPLGCDMNYYLEKRNNLCYLKNLAIRQEGWLVGGSRRIFGLKKMPAFESQHTRLGNSYLQILEQDPVYFLYAFSYRKADGKNIGDFFLYLVIPFTLLYYAIKNEQVQ